MGQKKKNKKENKLGNSKKKIKFQNLPKGWKESSLQDAFIVNETAELKLRKKYPFVDSRTIDSRKKEVDFTELRPFKGSGRRILPNDTLFLRSISSLKNVKVAKYVPTKKEGLAFSQTDVMTIREKPGVTDKDFAYYLASSPKFKNFAISRAERERGVEKIKMGSLSEFRFNLPPLSEQKKIVKLLNNLDEKIELNYKISKTLEDMALSLYKSWFVEFDPVFDNIISSNKEVPEELKEKLEIRKETLKKESKKRLAARRYYPLFPSEFTYTEEMGWIPKGWKVKTVGEEIEIIRGRKINVQQKEFWEDGTTHFCNTTDLYSLRSNILLDTERKLNEKGVKKIKMKSSKLSAGSILICSTESQIYTAISNMPVFISPNVIAMSSQDTFHWLYLFSWVKCNLQKILEKANESAFFEIGKKNFKTLPFLVPNNKLPSVFLKQTNSYRSRLISSYKEVREISKLKNDVFRKFLSGTMRKKEEK